MKDALLQQAPRAPNSFRIIWPIPQSQPLVSVIIPTRDRGDLVERCIAGLLQRTNYENLEILIVDNDSTDPVTLALFARFGEEDARIRVLKFPGPFNFSALINAGANSARGEIFLLLNNDVEVIESGWLREMVSQALRPDVGPVGAKLLYPDGKIQHGGIVIGPGGKAIHVHRFSERNEEGYFDQLALPRTLLAVTGACLAIRREIFFEIGGLDEINLAVTYNDVDLCLRAREFGYRTVWTPYAELFHLESVSRGLDNPSDLARFERELMYMRKRHACFSQNPDPFHNANILFGWDHLEMPSYPRREKPWYLSP